MKKALLLFWYKITNQKRFRVKYYPCGRFSILMTHKEASDYALIFGGQVIVDYNKRLQP